ncbi:MAG: SAM-dependent methyltransferase [Bryobacteraceae bacterium]|nr:MAG: SAM-dependent methyltransferase [Bryobacteraceae bacterium]
MDWRIRRWDLYSAHYDRFISFDRHRRRSLDLAELKPGERVLLCGCGTGQDLPLLPAGLDVFAVDASRGMLEKAACRRCASRVHLLRMDAQQLAFPDGCFDCVVLHLIVAIVPDPLACLKEAKRVLKPGGRIVLFDKYHDGLGRPRLVRRVLNPLMRLLATDLNVPLPRLARQAGFRIVHEEHAMMRGLFRIARLEPEAATGA